jgi:hypothetical protein
VEEKLLVNSCNKRLNVPDREKRTKQRWGQRFRTRPNVRSLADLASCFILSSCVEVVQGLPNEQKKQDRLDRANTLTKSSLVWCLPST